MSRFPPPAPLSVPPPPPHRRTDGRLIAAGIMMIAQAVFTLLAGLLALAFVDNSWSDDADQHRAGGIALAVTVLCVGMFLLWSGIAAIRGRHWARITLIVLEPLLVLPLVAAAVTGNSGDSGAALTVTVWGLVLFGLAIASRSKEP